MPSAISPTTTTVLRGLQVAIKEKTSKNRKPELHWSHIWWDKNSTSSFHTHCQCNTISINLSLNLTFVLLKYYSGSKELYDSANKRRRLGSTSMNWQQRTPHQQEHWDISERVSTLWLSGCEFHPTINISPHHICGSRARELSRPSIQPVLLSHEDRARKRGRCCGIYLTSHWLRWTEMESPHQLACSGQRLQFSLGNEYASVSSAESCLGNSTLDQYWRKQLAHT